MLLNKGRTWGQEAGGANAFLLPKLDDSQPCRYPEDTQWTQWPLAQGKKSLSPLLMQSIPATSITSLHLRGICEATKRIPS